MRGREHKNYKQTPHIDYKTANKIDNYNIVNVLINISEIKIPGTIFYDICDGKVADRDVENIRK